MAERVEQEIELTIEAVTGTVYDLCVSPFETILGIKTKIQRLEGIPVYQQHLVFDGLELQDDYCLEDYGVRSGCQLKLVLAMRGGPIHANRIQVEDSALLELADYLDAQSVDEDEPQFTVMLLSDGNIGVIKTGDSPIEMSNDRLSRGCTPKIGSQTKLENKLMREKVSSIQARLKDLRLGRAEAANMRLQPTCRKWKEVVILNNGTNTSASHTPTQPWTRRGSHSNGNVQRQLQFTQAEGSTDLPPVMQHKKLDKIHSLRHRRSDLLSGRNSRSSITESGHTRYRPSLPAADSSFSIQPTTRNDGEPFLPELLSRRRLLAQGAPSPPLHSIQSSFKRTRQRSRCMQCGKRMRLAATFTCRCGGIYCATHRYAEMHPCTFNYKAHGREVIARKNPLITAPKLPKI